MKHLQLTQSKSPTNPLDGSPYVYYNPDINKVWIYLGLKWLLEEGAWEGELQWANNGIWKMLCNYDPLQPTIHPVIDSGVYDSTYYSASTVSNIEFTNVVTDSNDMVIYGTYSDGSVYSPNLGDATASGGEKISRIINYIVEKEF